MKKNIRIGIDCDDVLYSCNEYALQIINEKNNTNFVLDDITTWGLTGTNLDDRISLYRSPSFVASQPVLPGAVEFLKELQKYGESFICSAVETEVMSDRGVRIKNDFPFIEEENIILGARKDLYDLNFLVDDSPRNIKESRADFPILFRRPWNSNMTGMLTAHNYSQVISIIRHILKWQTEVICNNKNIFVLVGCSGAGKSYIQESLVKSGVKKIVSMTTKKFISEEYSSIYNCVSKEEFLQSVETNELLEYSLYAGDYYGVSYDDISRAVKDTKHNYISVMDISGAIALKAFSDNVCIIYVDRAEEDIIASIINRNIPSEEKVKRLVSLPYEVKNKNFCDFVITNNGEEGSSVKKVMEIIKNSCFK